MNKVICYKFSVYVNFYLKLYVSIICELKFNKLVYVVILNLIESCNMLYLILYLRLFFCFNNENKEN